MRLLVINTVTDPASERLRRRFPGKVFQRPTIVGSPLPPRGRRVLPVETLKPDVVNHLEYLVSIGNVKVLELGGLRTQVDFADLRTRLGHPLPTGAPQIEEAAPPATPSVQETMEQARAYVAGLTDDARTASLARAEDGRLGWWVDTEQGRMFVDAPTEPSAPSDDTSTAVPLGAAEGPAVSHETCSICGESFPAPVSLHHSEEECAAAQAAAAEPAPTEPAAEPVVEHAASPGTPPTLEDVLGEEPKHERQPKEKEEKPGPGEKFELPADIDDLLRKAKNKPLAAVLALFGKNSAGKNKLVLISEAGACLSGDPDPLIANRAIALLREED